MTTRFFIKMKRENGSLERLLEKTRVNGVEIVDLTATRSLDQSFYFVRLGLEADGPVDGIREQIASLSEIRQVEVEQMAAAA